jgi:hypothetical protein
MEHHGGFDASMWAQRTPPEVVRMVTSAIRDEPHTMGALSGAARVGGPADRDYANAFGKALLRAE